MYVDAFTGKVYAYTLNSYNVWILSGTIESPLGTYESFGFELDLSGDYAIIGSANGYAFIYERSNDIWTLVKTMQSSNTRDLFGYAVAVDGDYAVVGAPGYSNTAGSVYIYHRDSTADWVLSQTLTSVAGYNSQFGYSVAIHNSTIAVGAPGYRPGVFGSQGSQTTNNTGWVYCYDFNPPTQNWALNQSIPSPVGYNSYFGVSVKISNYRLGIGADGYRKFLFLIMRASYYWSIYLS